MPITLTSHKNMSYIMVNHYLSLQSAVQHKYMHIIYKNCITLIVWMKIADLQIYKNVISLKGKNNNTLY